MSNIHRTWANSVRSKAKDYNQDTLHLESAIQRLLDERSNVTASIEEHLEFLKSMNFTHGIWETSDKLKSTNYNQYTLHSENAMSRVLHERSNIAS